MGYTNLIEILDDYNTEDECRELLENLKWPDGVVCGRCGSTRATRNEKRKTYECLKCFYTFSVTAGTALHNTRVPLRKWLLATYLMCESKKGMSALQIKRMLEMNYKTAWYLNHRIRYAIMQVHIPLLSGIIEVDETFVGGRNKGRYENWIDSKSIVVGMVQRVGKVKIQITNNRDRRTLQEFILKNITPEIEAIFTDGHTAYRGLPLHEFVNHSAWEWARGDVHTNTIEGVWSLLKRSIMGAYHHVSEKYLDLYLQELQWKYNNRDKDLWLLTLEELLRDGNYMSYKKLVSKYAKMK